MIARAVLAALVGVVALIGPNQPVVAIPFFAVHEQAKMSEMGIAKDVFVNDLSIHPQCHCAHADRNLLAVGEWESLCWFGALTELLSGEHCAFEPPESVHVVLNIFDLILANSVPIENAKDGMSAHLKGWGLAVILKQEDHIWVADPIQVRMFFDGYRNISPQLSMGGILSNVGLIGGQARIDTQENDARDSGHQRYFLECVMLFVLGIGLAVFGVCCAFFEFGGHALKAVFVGASLIVLGAALSGVGGYLLAAI